MTSRMLRIWSRREDLCKLRLISASLSGIMVSILPSGRHCRLMDCKNINMRARGRLQLVRQPNFRHHLQSMTQTTPNTKKKFHTALTMNTARRPSLDRSKSSTRNSATTTPARRPPQSMFKPLERLRWRSSTRLSSTIQELTPCLSLSTRCLSMSY